MRSRLSLIGNWNEPAEASGYSPSKLAKLCRVSVRHLERFLKQAIRRSPGRWLNELRQHKACELIKSGFLIKEVAAKLGYRRASHFSRDFKRFHGISPTQIHRVSSNMSHLDTKCRELVGEFASENVVSVRESE
jgi:AraC-like DNA-binding protein